MITYFTSVLVFWGACLALYAGLFRKEKFFHLNRIYLLLSMVLGLVIPLLELPGSISPSALPGVPVLLPEITVGSGALNGLAEGSPFLHWSQIVLWIYVMGCAWMLVRFTRQLFGLYRLWAEGHARRQSGYVLVENEKVSTPFSFLHLLFWNPALDADPPAARTIRRHELAHIRQGHSLDLLLHEITGIFFWWNPFWYAYGRALRNVHEYLADAAAIRESSVRDYGQLLLRQCLGVPAPALSHGLKNHSQLKNRIAMMTKSHSPKLALARYLAFLPLLALLTFACTQNEKEEMAVPPAAVTDPNAVYQTVDQMPVYGDCSGLEGEALSKCPFDNLVQRLATDLKYPEDARSAGLEGQVVVSFVILANGEIDKVKIVKSLSPSCDAEVERLVKAMPNWQPGLLDGKPVNVEMMLPVMFKLN
jgi:TonB family protein